jgi:sialic acid synthase SpsE
MTIKIGQNFIGNNHPCFITYEIGPTLFDIDSAKKLVLLAAKAGANAVKFQMINPDRLISDKNQIFNYSVLSDRKDMKKIDVSESLFDILKRRYLTFDEIRDLKKFSDENNIDLFPTIFYEEDLELVKDLNFNSLKIASADINYSDLIVSAAKLGINIQLDTGMSSLDEIRSAIKLIESTGNKSIIIHHCPSGYPARLEGINLNIIKTLKNEFSYPIAFSDHSPGYEMDIVALAFGVNLLEKTITLDRTTKSVEHIFSLENDEIKDFIILIRDLEIAFGKYDRILHDEEKIKRDSVRRSAHLLKEVKKGEKLLSSNFDFKRPGFGISPNDVKGYVGMKFNQDLPSGHIIKYDHFEK